jgi:hypothetical protein
VKILILLSHARTLAGTHAGFPFSPESPNFLVFIGAKIECTQAGTCVLAFRFVKRRQNFSFSSPKL